MLRDASTFTDKGRKEGLRTNNLHKFRSLKLPKPISKSTPFWTS
ncbi:hypothetical protein V3C99_015399 [Haemonchus contortus]